MNREKLFESIINDSVQLIQVGDLETLSMIYANDTAKKFFPFAGEDCIGKPCYKYFMGYSEQCPFCPLRDMDGRSSYDTVVHNGGRSFAVKTTVSELDGRKVFTEYARDITDEVKAREQFETQIRMLVQSMPNALGIFHMDVTDDVCLSVGGDAAAVPKEFSKYTIDHVVEDLENFISDEKEKSDFISHFSRKALINAYHNGTAQFDQVVRASYDDNGAKYARLAARIILNPTNDHIECVIYGVDVTEEIMEKYSHDATIKDQLDIFNALGKDYLNIYLIDPNTNTASILKLDGYVVGSIDIGKRREISYYDTCKQYIDERVHPDDRKMMLKAMKLETVLKKLEENGEYVSTYRIIENGETHYYQFKYIRYEGSRYIIVGFQNIDAIIANEKKQHEMLSAALAAAEKSSRAKTTFLNSISHDIRTPLNAIIGFTALAASHIDNTEAVKDYLSKIATSGNHLLSLINDVLDMSHIESGKITIEESPVHLSDLLNDLRMIVLPNVASKQLDLFIDTQNVMSEDVITDKLRLNQVLLNILSNAVKFTKPGGNIRFWIKEIEGAPDGYADFEFHIKDTGIGISDEFKDHIFEAFTREQTTTISGIQGTGLGMSIAKSIVDMMGGTITVNSELGKGSEFIVKLRFRTCGNRTQTDIIIPELKGMRALVADDDFNTCASITKMLDSVGMRSEWTTTGKEALLRTKFAIERRDEFGVYIIDWMIPDMNGVEITRRIRRIVGNSAPIIILTAYDWTEIESEAREAGVTAFCTKPIFMSELRGILSKPYSAAAPAEAEDKPQEMFSGKKILLVEDNELNAEIAAELLSDAGLEVDTAEDGEIAVKKMEEAAPDRYDLILMDVQMPKMNGYEATKRIRAMDDKAKANIPIIAMTANAFEEDRQNAINAGMNAHIAKPIDISLLFGTIKGFFNA